MAIKPVSQNNNFEQWVYTTKSLIDVSNSLTDGNINAYIVSANSRSIQAYDFANTVNVRVQSSYDFANTVNTFVWNTNANVNASYVKVNAVWDYTNTVNIHSQSLYDAANSAKTYGDFVYSIANAAFNYTNTAFYASNTAVQVQYVGSAASNTGTVTLPNTLQTDDVIILSSASDNFLESTLSGWTELTSVSQYSFPKIQYKRVTNPADITITGLSSGIASVATIFRNVYDLQLKSNTTSGGTNSGNPNVSVLSTYIASNSTLLLVGALDDDAVANTVTAQTGYTLANVSDSLNASNIATVMVAYSNYPVTSGRVGFNSSGSDDWYGYAIALNRYPDRLAFLYDNLNVIYSQTQTFSSYANSVNNIAVPLFIHTNAGFNFANTVNIRSEAANSVINSLNVSSMSLSDNSNTLATFANSDITNITVNNPGTYYNVNTSAALISLAANGRIQSISPITSTGGVSVNVQSSTIEMDDYLIFSTITPYTLFGNLRQPEIFGNTSTSNNSSTLNWPEGKQNGDIVFVASVRDDPTGGFFPPDTPTGFTSVSSGSFSNGASEGWYRISRRVINGSEGATISGLTSTTVAHIAIGVRNCNTSVIVDATNASLSNTASIGNGTFNAPDVLDITTVREHSGLLAFGFVDNNPAVFNSVPSGFANLGYSTYGTPSLAASVGVAFGTAKNIGVQSVSTFNITQSGVSTAGSTGSVIFALRGASISPTIITQNVTTINATTRVTYNANTGSLNTINLSINNALTQNVLSQNTDTGNVISINPSVYGKYQNILIKSNTTLLDNLANGQTSTVAIRNPFGNTITWPSTISWVQKNNNTPPYEIRDRYGFEIIELTKANSTTLFANWLGTFSNNSARIVGTATSSTTNTITLPTGLQANDIVLIASQSDTEGQTTPTGYINGEIHNNSNDLYSQWSYKIMGNPPDTTASGIANGSVAIAIAIRGVGEAIFDSTPPAIADMVGSTNMPNPPSVTFTGTGRTLTIVIGYLDDDQISASAPVNYTLLISQSYSSSGNTGTIMAAYRVRNPSVGQTEDPTAFGGTGLDVASAVTIPFISIGY